MYMHILSVCLSVSDSLSLSLFPLQFGGEAGVTNPQMKMLKPALMATSVILLGFTANFPAVSIGKGLPSIW